MVFKRQELWFRSWLTLLAALATVLGLASEGVWLHAQPVNPVVHRDAFEAAKKDAELVAKVRVLTVVCTEATKKGDKVSSVTLQVALQVLEVEKGPVKKNEIVVVSRKVTLPAGPGPQSYGYMGDLHRFPFTPGVKGSVALRWDKEGRAYVAVAGWVAEPNGGDIPKEVGQAISAKEQP